MRTIREHRPSIKGPIMEADAGRLKTFFVVQSFTRDRHGLRMDEPVQMATRMGALRTAKRLSARKASVIALARTGDMQSGEFQEPVVLVQYGEIDSENELPF